MKEKNIKKPVSLSGVTIFYLFLFILIGSQISFGQAEFLELYTTSDDTIPKGHYRSWSLLLISNPEWVLPENESKIADLYYRFKSFGNAIGPDHLAIWFWTQKPINGFFKYIDVMRSSAFCSRLKLSPSKSPFVIVTSEYPGAGTLSRYPESFYELKNFSVIELNGLKASEITQILSSLADRILSEKLDQIDPESEDFWRGLQRSYEYLRNNLVDLSKKIKITISTSFFSIVFNPE